ncbi:MAG: BON domain-containing protein [Candidatus Schekmanbacteria bacterium]|nr:BON domain-containing protein [Candidatus Schekmanbacteria bacterium]
MLTKSLRGAAAVALMMIPLCLGPRAAAGGQDQDQVAPAAPAPVAPAAPSADENAAAASDAKGEPSRDGSPTLTGLKERVSTELLRTSIRLALLRQLGTDAIGLRIEVDGEEAMLFGEVDTRAKQELAAEVAAAVEGVDKVRNHLVVVAAEPAGESWAANRFHEAREEVADAVLEAKIKLGLMRDLGANAFRVEVEATDGVVSLRGRLPGAEHRRISVEVASGTSGVRRVYDLLS